MSPMIKSAKRLLSGASYQKFRYVMKNTAISIVGLLLCSLELYAVSGGYPVANFALTVNVTEDGDMFGQVLRNPGELGEWLEDMGPLTFR